MKLFLGYCHLLPSLCIRRSAKPEGLGPQGQGPKAPPLLRGDGEDGHPLGAVGAERRGLAESVGDGEEGEAPEGEDDGDDGGHIFVGCVNECRGLGQSVNAIDDLFSFIFGGALGGVFHHTYADEAFGSLAVAERTARPSAGPWPLRASLSPPA